MVLRKARLAGAATVVLAIGFVGVVTLGTYAASGVPESSSAALGLSGGTVPAAYRPQIQKWGALCPEISAPMLAAQLYQESGFDPAAKSPAKAYGMAQFLEGTWATYGTDGDGDGKQDIWNAFDAIASAATYDCALARDVAKVPGDKQSNMLAAYNAGPYAVIEHSGIPPYKETQGYVRSIQALAKSFTAPADPGVQLALSREATGAIWFAQSKLGTDYLWGGTGQAWENGRFDCSGLTKIAYESVGIELPRVANDQWYAGPHPSRDQLRPGDLVFFANDLEDPRTIHHVGIYVGGGYMIDAPHTGAKVRYDTIDQRDYIGATRVTPDGAAALPDRNLNDGTITKSETPKVD
ncbi:bifunctional lytic transglycosylase/C40 family peptidase [Kitasatospora cineracea]|uniref:Cell wall-associated NlpC family hydrolase n=1 Tax=Kitasatospora cineracea TaxID=88074 RepID=A0A8G1XAN2_9ACTN|nr:bifunctional lytic transglycosylase/C40 family peptidase [Kitasatospora cineracea]ROR42784.1 cell wall-associated NlpC family hydrolase [Kitasatospora cineracea]